MESKCFIFYGTLLMTKRKHCPNLVIICYSGVPLSREVNVAHFLAFMHTASIRQPATKDDKSPLLCRVMYFLRGFHD
ncbi:hypothetical protein I7I53_01473 [Histoplasma capsulatum var. duboisii H88]|nr:hypothetical protein I7I53_01473 [Histoplasma capsulatum var. duboisii H88]